MQRDLFQSSDISAQLESQSLGSERTCFGGSLLKNSHAKVARPLSSKKALHLVLKPSQNKHQISMISRERLIRNLVLKQGRTHNVKVFNIVLNAQGVQLILRFTKRRNLQNFLRSLCGILARKTLKAERGRPSTSNKFWAQRPFTRIINWGPSFEALQNKLSHTLENLPSFGFLPLRQQKYLGILEIRKRVMALLSSA